MADLLVFLPRRSWTCAGCSERDGDFRTLEGDDAYCLSCADLDGLVFLKRGDAALSRRARKASTLSAIVLEFSRPGNTTSGRASSSSRPRSTWPSSSA